MSNNKHTPAPWICSLVQTGEVNSSIPHTYFEIKPKVFASGEDYLYITGWMRKENARLIAAAPETKEVCDLLKDWNDWSSATTYEEVVKELASIIAKAESAIAKAEGRS